MREFTVNDVAYSIKQKLNNGIQYQARYADGLSAWAFIAGKKHTRAEVIQAIDDVNLRNDNER